ncbi:MAG: hypothetical protein KDK66_04870, partial [Deltaproteobacteria bacterium]|nr:hypothetical protein [Deltaproteobacteria bacterium]
MALAGREKSMGFLWFLVASLLITIVLWLIYDEVIGRRSWKKYAAEWETMEVSRLEKLIAEEKAKINEETLNKIRMAENKAKLDLESDAYKALVEKFNAATVNYQNAKTKLQFAKADLDEIFYLWKHAKHEDKDFEPYKNKYYTLEKKIETLTKEEAQADDVLKEAKKAKEAFTEKLKDLEKQEADLYKNIEPLKRQLEAVKDRGTP